MRICFVLNADPESIGGTPNVVRNIKKYIKNSEAVFGKSKGLFSFIYPFITAIKILSKNNKYDIINIHDTQGFVYSVLPKFMRKKIIYTSHGLWDIEFSKFPPKNTFQAIKAAVAKKMQRAIIRRSDHITTVSNYIKKYMIDNYNIDELKITVIYNGIDTKKFYDMKKKKQKNIALWVGKDPVRKGLKEAILYAKKKKMKIWVIGITGKDDKTTKYLGTVSEKALIEAYNTASVLIFFSKSEAHPLVPLEAMACGLDIIASKESNIEIIKPRPDGTYQISGKKAKKIMMKYSWEKQTKKYIKTYKAVSREK